ncbi:hypothetical protein [Litoreibacter janthinus]|uniref:Uncharacterized protein n=1 Tax=Litoreibacter janthinus TaxID=670154 RepID=A0A1I6GEK2_9RHOB|nr:hypothetical protein [Litoreibacter janthinus]SFR40635.1 hypothetical protein SAMN04488002_1349 [Litoreibacter janthinus]
MDFEAETQKIELERRRLEVEKMRVEIADASRPLWLRPGSLASLSPLLIALAGVFAAWVTGYFDTQRTQLANDIAALETEKADLSKDVQAAQNIIDNGYLRIRMAAGEALYALGHFGGFSEEYEAALQNLFKFQERLSDDGIAAVNTVAQISADRFNVVEISRQSLSDLNTTLANIEASDWAKELTTDPILRSVGLFLAPDGSYYDVEKERFLTETEAQNALPNVFTAPSSD